MVIKRHTVLASKSAMAVAMEVGMTLEELLELNPEIAGMSVVPQDFVVNVKGKPRGR